MSRVLLYKASLPIVAPPPAGQVLFTEEFNDSALVSRGWYDLTAPVVTTLEDHTGGVSGALQMEFTLGATNPIGGALRHLFTPTDTLYISYWVKYSSNWIGSGTASHPHEIEVMTDLDGDFGPPANTRLTMLLEHNYQSGGIPRIAAQDNVNIDQANIGVDLTGITELRSAHGCNGQVETTHTLVTCFGTPAENGRFWDDTQVRFTDAIKNNWNKVEAYFQLNSIVGGIGQADGIIRYWFNGSLTMEHTGVLLRTGEHPTMMFNQFLFIPFIGAGAPVAETIWYDDLVVGTGRPAEGGTPRPGSASLNVIVFQPSIALTPGIAQPGKADLTIASFSPTINPLAGFPEIMRANWVTGNPWALTGQAQGFQDGGGGIPGSPHSAGAGSYHMVMPTGAWGAWAAWTFLGTDTYTSVEMTIPWTADKGPNSNTKGWRFVNGTSMPPSGSGLGGLFVSSAPGADRLSFVFEGFGSFAYNISTGIYHNPAAVGADVLYAGLSDGTEHIITFTYDVGGSFRRMKCAIDGTVIAHPNGTPGFVSGFFTPCSSDANGGEWQDGWMVFCTSDGPTVLGGGSWIDTAHANDGPIIDIGPTIWRDAS